MADRITALRLAPDAPKSEIEAATSRFVAMYLASSRIDPHWRPILARLSEHPTAITVVATDHYAEATGKIIRLSQFLGHPRKESRRRDWHFPRCPVGGRYEPNPFPRSPCRAKRHRFQFVIANSADLGVWKADRRFWEILKSRLPLAAVRRILLIDDFGFNEEPGDSYGGRAKVTGQAGEDHCQY